MTWLLEFPAPTDWLTLNQRMHHMAKYRIGKQWADATLVWATAKKLPKGLDKVRIEATLSFPTNRVRDEANYHPTLKPCVDALVRYGLMIDDDPKHLDGPHIAFGEKTTAGLGWLALDIREVT